MNIASKALQIPLCDRCLGRLFARSGFGLDNSERGRSIRVTMALIAENPLGGDIKPEPDVASRLPVHHKSNQGKSESDLSEDISEETSWNIGDFPSMERTWTEVRHGDDICYLCENLFENLDTFVSLIREEAKEYEFNTFQVGKSLDPSTIEREQEVITRVQPRSAEPLKEEINREVGKRLQMIWKDPEVDRSDPDLTFILDPLFKEVKSQVKTLFIKARYRKLKRGIPQTRWPCRNCHGKGCPECDFTGRRYEVSVEEIIGEPFKKYSRADDYKLHGMGREDVDVRMLGNGRPFVLEITRPRVRDIDLDRIADEINNSNKQIVGIMEPEWTNRKDIAPLKEAKKKKRYRCQISFEQPVDEKKLKYGISLLTRGPIHQRTPERVSHRRADKVRERKVHEAKFRVLDDLSVEVEIMADGGLYIKELLHGDRGRTDPSLASALGAEVQVESLDVLDVLEE